MKQWIGIIGGMGPLAGADLFCKITGLTRAVRDQDHIHILLDSDSSIPDRTAAILSGGQDPAPALAASARRLEQAGAGLLVIACNTAHWFYPHIAEAVSCPVLHMIAETARACREQGIARAGLLATDGTLESGLYHRELKREGIAPVVPDPPGQRLLMDWVYSGIKAGNNSFDLSGIPAVLQDMRRRGAEVFLLGCTELPLAFAPFSGEFPALDPTDLLARRAVQEAGYPLQT